MNEGEIYRVPPANAWNEDSVTWTSFHAQPAPPGPAVPIPASGSTWNWNVSIDVTQQTSDIYTDMQNGVPDANQGYFLKLLLEKHYRQVQFASSDHPDSTLWPELCITYKEKNLCDFSYCISSNGAGTVRFQADNTSFGTNYRWYVDGVFRSDHTGGSSTPLPPGIHDIYLTILDEDGNQLCENRQQICIGRPVNNTVPPFWCYPDFSICGSTANPGYIKLVANQTGFLPQQYLWTVPGTTSYINGESIIIPSTSGTISLIVVYYAPYYSKCMSSIDMCAPFKPAPAGIENIAFTSAFTISASPNPVTDQLNIDYLLKQEGSVSFTVYDAVGSSVWHNTLNLPAGNGKVKVPFTGLSAGIYTLKTQKDKETKTLRIVKTD